MICAVLLRCRAYVFFEKAVEIGEILIPERIGNHLDGLVGGDERELRTLQEQARDEHVRRLARSLLELSNEMAFRHASLSGKVVDVEAAADVATDVGQHLVDAAVLDLRLGRGELQEARHQDEDDATRLDLVTERALQVLLIVVDERLMVVVGVGIGLRHLQERVDIVEPLEELEVHGLGFHLDGEVVLVEYADAIVQVLEHVYIIMCKERVADVTMAREGRNEIEMARAKFVSARRHHHFCPTLGDVIESRKRAADILPVPVAVVTADAHIEHEQMQLVY